MTEFTKIKLDDPFDPPAPKTGRPARPKDAATLILVRGGREVLMGQRSAGHVFMPDKWVFPGGRVDPGDATAPAATEFPAATEALLRHNGVRRPPRAFGLAATRETLEETGLRVGGPEGPALDRLAFICRAVTPPYRPRRFDARFFLAKAEEVLASDKPEAGEELLSIRWFSLEDAEALDLPSITRFVLGEVRARLAGEPVAPAYLRWTRGAHRLDRLS
ncbi:MAG: NUDIX hydrolase [Alphaproteobacteria bacterium]